MRRKTQRRNDERRKGERQNNSKGRRDCERRRRVFILLEEGWRRAVFLFVVSLSPQAGGRSSKMERDSAGRLLSQSDLSCRNCGQAFFRRCNLNQHEKAGRCKSKSDALKCPDCPASFSRSDSLRRHLVTVHKTSIKQMYACGICEGVFRSQEDVAEHRKTAHTAHTDFDLVESAFSRQTQLLRCFIPEDLSANMESTFDYVFKQLVQLVDDMRTEFKYFKMGTVLHVEMARYDEQGQLTELKVFPFRAFSACFSRVSTKTQVVTSIAKVVGDYERAMEEFLHMGSGWTVTRGMFLEAEVSHCLPLSGFTAKDCTLHIGKYNTKVEAVTAQNFTARPLERELREENVNCFYLAMAAYYTEAYYWGDHKKMIARAKELFHFVPKAEMVEDVGFSIEDIDKFEVLNSHIMASVCVLYRDEDNEIIPVRTGNGKSEYDQITLLLFFDEDKELHYALIADPNKALARRNRQLATGKLQTCGVFVCNKCFNLTVRD